MSPYTLFRMKPDQVCTIIMACAVLQNIAVERHEPEPEAEEDELFDMEDGDEYVGGAEGDGLTVRDYMAQTYF